MNSDHQNFEKIQSIDELIAALSATEKTSYNDIIRSMNLPIDVFEQYCFWSDKSYTRNCIADTEKFELILLCWTGGQATPIHDHGGEECWVKIISGEFSEKIYTADDSGDLKLVRSFISKVGDISYMIDRMGFHSLENLTKERSLSLHYMQNLFEPVMYLTKIQKTLLTKICSIIQVRKL